MSDTLNLIQELLEKKAALKQDIFQDTKRQFERFKQHLLEEIGTLRHAITDERVRLHVEHKGEFQVQVYIGSDVLIFQMHTNIFRLPEEHPLWKTEYLKEDKERGYFGIINIYNFLAESYLKSRLNDLGYLIGRIFINKDEHYMVEGKGQLGFASSFSIGSLVIAKPASRIAEYSIRSRDSSRPSYQAPMITANTGKIMKTNDRMIGLRRLSSMKYTIKPPTDATRPR